MVKRSKITRDLRSPKYRQRIVPNKKKTQAKKACRSIAEIMDEAMEIYAVALRNLADR